ncbi:unnamed protein product [Linum perenne]
MSYGRGRGRGGRWGGRQQNAKQEPYILFPEVELPDRKTVKVDKSLIAVYSRFQAFWKASSYYLEDTVDSTPKRKKTARRLKKPRWAQALDVFEKLEQNADGKEMKEGEEEEEEEDEEALAAIEEEEFSDDDYNQNEYCDDDEDDFNEEAGDDAVTTNSIENVNGTHLITSQVDGQDSVTTFTNHEPAPHPIILLPPKSLFLYHSFRSAETERGKQKKKSAKMSWQTYVDEHLMCDIEGNHLASAAIIGHDGSVWAQSANFPQCKPDEIAAMMKDFDEPGTLAPTGLHLAGTKYMVIQGEAGAVIRGKKGAGGVTVKKTGQALVFGLYEEPVTPGQCNMVVERLGDYLVDQGL